MTDYQRLTDNLRGDTCEALALEVRHFVDSCPAKITQVLDFLANLGNRVAVLQLPTSELTEAISSCVRAFQFYDRDPSLKDWCDWRPRLGWIERELHALSVQKETGSSIAGIELQKLRDFYRDDLGLPLDAGMRYQESLKRKNIAWIKASLYEAGASLCCAINQWPQCHYSSFTSALLAPLAALKAEHEMPQLLSQILSLRELDTKESFSREAWRLWGSILQPITAASPAHEYQSLSLLAEHERLQITSNLQVCVYDKYQLPGEHVMESFNGAMKASRNRSAHYTAIDITDIEGIILNNDGKLVTLGYKSIPLFYGVVIIHDYNFLERTQLKLAAFDQLELSTLPVHSWLFMVASDYANVISLRELQVDWYSLFTEAVSDVVLHHNGEDILGIVEMGNPAINSHSRVGFQRLGKRTFVSDSGGEALIVSKPL